MSYLYCGKTSTLESNEHVEEAEDRMITSDSSQNWSKGKKKTRSHMAYGNAEKDMFLQFFEDNHFSLGWK